MSHTPTIPEHDPKLYFPAARPEVQNAAPINHGNDMNMGLIATIAAGGSMVVFVIITLTQAWFFHMQDQEVATKSHSNVNLEMLELRQSQMNAIGDNNNQTYRWLDSNNKTVALPIGRAMELTVSRYNQPDSQ